MTKENKIIKKNKFLFSIRIKWKIVKKIRSEKKKNILIFFLNKVVIINIKLRITAYIGINSIKYKDIFIKKKINIDKKK